jgi:hypothetical protein
MKRLLVLLIVAACVASAAAMAQASPVPGAVVKVSQPPEMTNEWGVDIESNQFNIDTPGAPSITVDKIIADDWMCPDGRPITDIHWWGSYFGNPVLGSFRISIFTDVPASAAAEIPSHPGNLLYNEIIPFSDAHEVLYPFPGNTSVYQYYVVLPKPFPQTQGTIYWLSIEAIAAQPPGNVAIWGWHTAVLPDLVHNLDDAVAIFNYDFQSGTYNAQGYPETWHDIHWEVGELNPSLDMAFELTTVPEPATIMMIGGALVGFAAVARRKFLNR